MALFDVGGGSGGSDEYSYEILKATKSRGSTTFTVNTAHKKHKGFWIQTNAASSFGYYTNFNVETLDLTSQFYVYNYAGGSEAPTVLATDVTFTDNGFTTSAFHISGSADLELTVILFG